MLFLVAASFVVLASSMALVSVVLEELSPCSCSSWWRKDVVSELRSDLDSAVVRGSLGCVNSRRLAAMEAAGRTRS